MPTLYAANNSAPTGARQGFTGLTAPEGWVLASGRTFGNAASGALERANADTFALFVLLYTNYSNALLPVSPGGRTGAGTTIAEATTDYNANKTITLPDYRGRVGAGKDNMGGTNANRITAIAGTTLGGNGGAESHTLSTAQIPGHTHAGTTGGESGHTHNNPYAVGGGALILNAGTAGTNVAGYVGAPTTTGSGHMHGFSTDNGTGGGGGHNNLQPVIIETAIIKL